MYTEINDLPKLQRKASRVKPGKVVNSLFEDKSTKAIIRKFYRIIVIFHLQAIRIIEFRIEVHKSMRFFAFF